MPVVSVVPGPMVSSFDSINDQQTAEHNLLSLIPFLSTTVTAAVLLLVRLSVCLSYVL